MPVSKEQIDRATRLRHFGIDREDIGRLAKVADVMKRHVPAALEKLYEKIAATPAVFRLFGGNRDNMAHAKAAQIAHWHTMFSGEPGLAYLENAAKIGRTHARIGLEPTWYIGGYATVLEDVIVAMLRYAPPGVLDGGRSAKAVATLVKMSLLDMDLALSSYFAVEEAKRAEVIDQLNETMRQIEEQRLAREKATQRIGAALAALAANDFTAKLDGLPEDFAQLGRDFEEMRTNVSKALAAVAHSVSGISTGSAEIRAAADDLAMRTQQQAASLEETVATMEQLTVGVESAATGAEEINVKVHEANGEAQTGETVACEAVAAMEKIQRSAHEIRKIIELIDGIAFQTNLVALNAGVEAVRAGEAGKGFAVVANEVRALAQRSAGAAREIKELVTGSVDEVEKGVELVRHSGRAFSRITGRVGEIAERIDAMSANSRAQSTSLQQVNVAVREMDQMTQQNAAMVEQTTAASRSLAGEAQDLDAMVSRFQLGREESVVQLTPPRRRKPVQPAPPRRVMGGSSLAAQKVSEDWSEF
jgi:methyl-accepting chemotaxis protein